MIKVLASCGAGIGSSMIIKKTINDVFKELEIPVEVTHESIGLAKSGADKFDIIFTLKPLIKHFEHVPDQSKVVGISNIMDKNEVREAVVRLLDLK